MAQASATIVESFAVPPAAVFERLVDHEGMTKWMDARVSVVAGPLDGGVGTIRRINARGLTIDEEVVYVDPPRRLVYRIVRGVPMLSFHRGEILVEPWGKTGCEVRWSVILDSPVPGLARAAVAALGPALRDGLGRLRTQLLDAA